MNAPASDANAPPPAEAGWFGPGERPRFGWLHRAARPSGVALVIVPPFGYEAVCAHRSLRHLAEDSARAGVTAVRFDLDGTGDSAGDDLDPGRVEAWLASIDDACNLARSTGATRLVLAGVRLGAMLATLAALRRDDVTSLALINPVIKGKAFLREARALQAALGLAPAPTPADDGVQELVGFAISAETQGSLAAIDLVALEKSPAPSVLLIERDDMPASDALPAHLRSLGTEVEVARLPGYVGMMLDPMDNIVPDAILQAVVGLATRHASTLASAGVPLPAPLRETATVGNVEECLYRVAGMTGVLTRHAGHEPDRLLVLLSIGAVVRWGSNRSYVDAARTLASGDLAVLRIDLSGIGDSPARAGARENRIYTAEALDDTDRIVRELRQRDWRRLAAGGMCSAGYHALRKAIAHTPIDTVLLINPLVLRFAQNIPARFELRSDVMRHRQSMRSLGSWRKLLAGKVNLLRVGRVVWWHARTFMARNARELARALHLPLANDLGCDLRALAHHHVDVQFVFSDNDPGRLLLNAQAGSVVRSLQRRSALGIHAVPGADHTFTPRWTHPLLLQAVRDALAKFTST
jgi:alpha-beta hydrolase superfamily lysophospholipase